MNQNLDIPGMLRQELNRIRGGKAEIKDTHSLYHDLGVYGDDAFELFEFLRQQLKVDLTGLDLSTYVPSEGEGHLTSFFRRRSKKEERLPISHIVEVARQGKWFPPRGINRPTGN